MPEVARELQDRLGVAARFVQRPEARTPFSFGVVAPTIVLPAGFDTLERQFQRAIVCHELLHVQRRDFVTAFVEEAVVAILWFHPWVWLIRRRLRVAREQVVDAAVVRVTGDRSAYVRCLVALAGHRLAPQLGSSMLHPRELRVRVDALLQEVDEMSTPRLTIVATVLCLLLGTTMWFFASTVPLRAMSAHQLAEPLPETGQPPAQPTRIVVMNFSLPGGHHSQIRGAEGQFMRIVLRDAGRFGFVPTIRSDRRVVVTVYDLDGVPDRPLGEVEVVVGGDAVTFGTSPAFEIAVPRVFSAVNASPQQPILELLVRQMNSLSMTLTAEEFSDVLRSVLDAAGLPAVADGADLSALVSWDGRLVSFSPDGRWSSEGGAVSWSQDGHLVYVPRGEVYVIPSR